MPSIYLSGGAIRFEIEGDDGIRRLREAVGQLLQVNQLCVLLGSGASFHLGSPRIRAVSRDSIAAMCAAAEVELSAEVGSLLDALAQAPVDLEALLGQLAASLAYAEAFGREDVEIAGVACARKDVQELFGAVNIGLAGACDLPGSTDDLEPPHDVDPWYSHREFFRRLVGSRRPEAPRAKVFTTNYDTVIERSLDDCGIHCFDGFVGGVRRALNLGSYDDDLYRPSTRGRGGLLRVHDALHLYKLHGSLNWRVESSPSTFGSRRIVQVAAPPSAGELAVIYPTPTKEVDVLGHPYADLLRIFGATISTPECALLVLGYGFADEHINRLIYQAMAQNSTLQLFIADPVGIIDPAAQIVDGGIDRVDSPLGRLSTVPDARITMLTGDAAKFSNFALTLPDVADRTPEQQHDLEEALATALLPPPVAPLAGDVEGAPPE